VKLATRIFLIAGSLATLLLIWLTSTQSGFDWAYQRAESYLPQKLTIKKVAGRFIGPISIEGLEYKQDKNTVKADQITLDWLPSALLRARIDIQLFHVETLKIDLAPSESDNTAKPITLPNIHLPWRLTMQDAQIKDLRLNQGEKTVTIKSTKLSATAKLSRVSIEEFSIEADDFRLRINGTLRPKKHYNHNLSIHWQANFPSGTVTQGHGQLAGDLQTTRITQQLDGPLKASLNASLHNLLDKLSWQASANISQFDLRKWNTQWPALKGSLTLDSRGDLETATLSGAMKGDYPESGPFDADFDLKRLSNNTIQINHLNIRASHNQTQLNSYGQWLPGANGGDIKLSLNWKNLRWPIQEPAWFDSAYGDALITGNVDHYKIRLTTDTPRPELPPSSWSVLAEGNLDGLTLNALQISALGGEAITTGKLNWTPNLSWKAELNATNINPSSVWPQWPGNLSAKIDSSGQIKKGQLIAHAEIKKLGGQLRDYPVSLNSKLTLRDNNIDISHLNFSSGTAQVSAQGKIGAASKLKWHISATDIGALYPQAKGQLNAEGWLTDSQEKPFITATIKGENLTLPEYKIGTIEGQLAVDLFHWQKTNIELTTQSLLLKGQALQKLSINGGVKHLTVEAISDQAAVQLEVEGETTTTGWQGSITRADIQSQQLTNWQLSAPTALRFDNKSLSISALCWEGAQDASICTSLQRENTNWQSKLKIKQLPLSLLSGWATEGLKIDGVLNASAKLRFQDASLLGKASVQLPQGVVYYPLLEGERDHWAYHGGKVNIFLSEKGLETDAKFAMSNGDTLQFNAELPGAQLLTLDYPHQTLLANAQLSAHDLGLIEALIPEIQDLRGNVALNINATGTLTKPVIKGNAKLIDGSLRIPRLGLTVDQLSLHSQNDASEDIQFQLKARSGGGNLVVDGKTRLDAKNGWPTHLRITGKEFEMARIPEAQVLVSPNLLVKVQKRDINIAGDVHIPYARLQPKDITTAAHVSDDAIILGDELTAIEKWAVTSNIRLTLGDRVNFYGFGFEGRFGGNLLLEDEPGQSTRATGEINIPEGRYRAYGQRLDIEQGRFIFSGGPPSNPGLDVRAVRHINQVTAGVKLRGNLNKPQVELFSNPAMGETDTLSYLLLGRPMEGASSEDGNMMAQAALALGLNGGDRIARALGNRFGMDEMRVESNDSGDQASLVLGRYLSPKLYVGYGVGILKATNTFSLRYQINQHWQLKGESGENSGMDILYTIDR
jgi:translocation and assembly module TamB